MKVFLSRMLAVCVATLCVSMVFAALEALMHSGAPAYVYTDRFESLFTFYCIVNIVYYVSIGVPASLILDKKVRNAGLRLLGYIVVGMAIVCFTILVLVVFVEEGQVTTGLDFWFLIVYASTAAIVLYVVNRVADFFVSR